MSDSIAGISDFDWDELEKELNEFNSHEEESEFYTMTDYYGARQPMSREEDEYETETVPLGADDKKSEDKIKFGEIITEDDVMQNSSILYPEQKLYRSLILDFFTPEQCFEIEKISRSFSISNNQKVDLIRGKMNEWGIDFAPLGSGTNRYAFMKDGYVIKVALDKDGKIDNKREFMYSLPLQPYVVKCYETLPDGLMAVFEYVEIFTIDDYWKSQDKMREILNEIARNFLIGDVGVNSANYVNWGFRDDSSLVILDYAYIYSVAFKKFTCNCSPSSVLHYDKDFNNLICPVCGKKYDFKTIRKKISRADQDAEIGDITEKGYLLSSPEEECKFNPRFVYGAFAAIFEKLIKIKKKQNERITRKTKKHKNEDVEPMDFDELIKLINEGKMED